MTAARPSVVVPDGAANMRAALRSRKIKCKTSTCATAEPNPQVSKWAAMMLRVSFGIRTMANISHRICKSTGFLTLTVIPVGALRVGAVAKF